MFNKVRISGYLGIHLLVMLSMMSAVQTVQAEENLWVYTRGTDTRPKDSVELKIQDTIRWDKNSGDYTFHDIRPNVEYGITDSLTVGATLMIFNHDYSVDPDTGPGPMVDTQAEHGGSFKDTQIGGFVLGAKYNILSPYKDLIGLSIGFNYDHRWRYRLDGAQIDQDSFVPIVYLQKKLP